MNAIVVEPASVCGAALHWATATCVAHCWWPVIGLLSRLCLKDRWRSRADNDSIQRWSKMTANIVGHQSIYSMDMVGCRRNKYFLLLVSAVSQSRYSVGRWYYPAVTPRQVLDDCFVAENNHYNLVISVVMW